jgi:hypothetical protein
MKSRFVADPQLVRTFPLRALSSTLAQPLLSFPVPMKRAVKSNRMVTPTRFAHSIFPLL